MSPDYFSILNNFISVLPVYLYMHVARHLTCKSEVLGSIPGLATFLLLLIKEGQLSVTGESYWQKYVHKVLVNHLGGLSLPRKNVVRLTDCPDMTLHVYHGCKTTTRTTIYACTRAALQILDIKHHPMSQTEAMLHNNSMELN